MSRPYSRTSAWRIPTSSPVGSTASTESAICRRSSPRWARRMTRDPRDRAQVARPAITVDFPVPVGRTTAGRWVPEVQASITAATASV